MRTPHLRALINYFNYLYMYVRELIQHQNICSVQCEFNQIFIYLFILNTYPSIKSIKSQVCCLSIHLSIYLSIYPIAIFVPGFPVKLYDQCQLQEHENMYSVQQRFVQYISLYIYCTIIALVYSITAFTAVVSPSNYFPLSVKEGGGGS